MSSDVTARLEAVAARLERVAAKLGGKGGGDDDSDVPMYVADYEAIINTELKAALAACEKLKIEGVVEPMKKAYNNNLDLIKRVPNSKKPSQQDLMAFLKPGIDAIGALDTIRYKGYKGNSKTLRKYGDHWKAMYEAVMVISWVTMAPPQGLPWQHVCGQEQACMFNMGRVQKSDKSDEAKAWIKAMNALNKKVAEFVKEYFKSGGLTWNPKGSALSEAAAASSGGGDDEKKQTKTKKAASSKKGGGGGMNAVFGALSKGTGITKGMKKVTGDMKTKNRKERTGKVQMKTQKKKQRKKYGPPQTKFQGGRWMVECYEEGLVVVDQAKLKQNVFITMCDNCTIQIKGKVKAVTIDNCVKVRVYIDEVISSAEMVNCKSTTLYVMIKAPSVSVDKCESPAIILSRAAYEVNPDIYTSNVSAMNVEVPGKTDDDDNKEYAIPEQFLTKIDCKTGKCTTSATEH
eukprot:347600_1